jgi:hypothetical protein
LKKSNNDVCLADASFVAVIRLIGNLDNRDSDNRRSTVLQFGAIVAETMVKINLLSLPAIVPTQPLITSNIISYFRN